MSNEILSFIKDKKKLSVLDCTFGGGGHSLKFLEKGHSVTAIDKDNISLVIAKKFMKKCSNFLFYNKNFKDLDLIIKNKKKYNFILLDLGFSSNQLENPDIGLSFET